MHVSLLRSSGACHFQLLQTASTKASSHKLSKVCGTRSRGTNSSAIVRTAFDSTKNACSSTSEPISRRVNVVFVYWDQAMFNLTLEVVRDWIDNPFQEIVTWYQVLHFITIFIVVSLFGFAFLIGCMFVGLSSCSAYSPCQQYRIQKLRQRREVMPYFRPIYHHPMTV